MAAKQSDPQSDNTGLSTGDSLAALLTQFGLNARVFHSGELCGAVRFGESGGLGYLHVLRAGRLDVVRPGHEDVHVDTPSFLFFPRAIDHRFVAGQRPGAEMVCATFDFGSEGANPVLAALPDMIVVALKDAPGAAETTSLLFREAFGAAPGRQTAVDQLTNYFLVLLLRHILAKGVLGRSVLAAFGDPRLSRAVEAMHTDPGADWTLERLAERAGMSRARFAERFKALCGTTPLDYLTHWRIGVAQEQLRRGRPLKAVAAAVGYASVEAFGRAFSRRAGATPGAWLAQRAAAPAVDVPYRRLV